MANQSVARTIKNSWTLVQFARIVGKHVTTGECANHDTGETFKAVAFTNDEGQRTFASFSSKLGVLSGAEIARQKDELQIVQFEESGNYCLCKKGENSWENVDLGL